MKPCECGCGELTSNKRFVQFHHLQIHNRSEEHRQFMSEYRKTHPIPGGGGPPGERNGRWKGDEAGLGPIHGWVRKMKKLTGVCSWCGRKPPPRREELPGKRFRMVSGIDLHNISGEYRRDVDDYVEICRDCHNKLKRKEAR